MLKAVPTRPGPLAKALRSVRAAYVRMLIDACERDIEHHAFMQERDAALERNARQRLDELRVHLMDIELEGRTR